MPKMIDDLSEEYIKKSDWWGKLIVLLVIALNIVFVREILGIFREYQTEPYALIGLVTTLSVGEFSIMYFIFRNRKEIVRETISYDRDYEMISGGLTHEAKMATDEQEHDVKMVVDEQKYAHHMEPDYVEHDVKEQGEKKDVEFCQYEEIGMVDDLDDIFKDKEE